MAVKNRNSISQLNFSPGQLRFGVLGRQSCSSKQAKLPSENVGDYGL